MPDDTGPLSLISRVIIHLLLLVAAVPGRVTSLRAAPGGVMALIAAPRGVMVTLGGALSVVGRVVVQHR